MKLATRIFLAVFWFVMGMFFFVMFSIHGIKGDLAPVVAFLGMTVFGLGFLYVACYCLADLAKYVYSKIRDDFQKGKPEENANKTESDCAKRKSSEETPEVENSKSVEPESERRETFLKRSEQQAIANAKALYQWQN